MLQGATIHDIRAENDYIVSGRALRALVHAIEQLSSTACFDIEGTVVPAVALELLDSRMRELLAVAVKTRAKGASTPPVPA